MLCLLAEAVLQIAVEQCELAAGKGKKVTMQVQLGHFVQACALCPV